MPFDHRYLWSTSFVRERLRVDGISESALFRYFLVIMTFDWLQFTGMATTPTVSVSAWSLAAAWITFFVTIAGLVYLYARNGGAGSPAPASLLPALGDRGLEVRRRHVRRHLAGCLGAG